MEKSCKINNSNCNNPFRDNCGNLCMKKMTMAATFIVAVLLAFFKPDSFDLVALFLGIGFGNSAIVGAREIIADKKE